MYTPLAADQMHQLVDLLQGAEPPLPAAVGISTTADEVELAWRPLLECDPIESLVGVRAPAHWSAFAVCARGEARPHDGSGRATTPVRLVHLVTRDGRQATDLRAEGRPGSTRRLAEPGTGWVADVCRRVLSLPTPPPTTTTAELLAVVWLDAILAEIIEGDLDGAPPDGARCRSLLGPLAQIGPLEHLGAEVARQCPWPIIRRLGMRVSAFGVSRAAAAWLDDGSFARLVMGGFAPVDELRDDVVELLDPAAAGEVSRIVGRWLVVGGL